MNGSVLTIRAVEDGHDDVHLRVVLVAGDVVDASARRRVEGQRKFVLQLYLRQAAIHDVQALPGALGPGAFLSDADGQHLVLCRVKVSHDGAGGDAGHRVLGAAAAVHYGNAHRFRFSHTGQLYSVLFRFLCATHQSHNHLVHAHSAVAHTVDGLGNRHLHARALG